MKSRVVRTIAILLALAVMLTACSNTPERTIPVQATTTSIDWMSAAYEDGVMTYDELVTAASAQYSRFCEFVDSGRYTRAELIEHGETIFPASDPEVWMPLLDGGTSGSPLWFQCYRQTVTVQTDDEMFCEDFLSGKHDTDWMIEQGWYGPSGEDYLDLAMAEEWRVHTTLC